MDDASTRTHAFSLLIVASMPAPQVLRDPTLTGNVRVQGRLTVNGTDVSTANADSSTASVDSARVDAVFESQRKLQRAVELLHEKLSSLPPQVDTSDIKASVLSLQEKWTTFSAEHTSMKNTISAMQLQLQQQLETQRELKTTLTDNERKLSAQVAEAAQAAQAAQATATAKDTGKATSDETLTELRTSIGDLTKKVFLMEKRLNAKQ